MASVGSIIERQRRNSSSSVLQFPENLGQHAVMLAFKKYSYSKPGTRGLNRLSNDTVSISTITGTDTILFPLPRNISENFNVNLPFTRQGIFGETVSAAASQVNNIGAAATAESIVKSIIPGFSSSGAFNPDALARDARFLARRSIDAIAPEAGQNIDIGLGSSVNPKSAIFFDGVSMKKHQFNWIFAPSTPNESDVLKNIENTIKRNMLPTYGSIGGFTRMLLNYPSLCDIYFFGLDQSYFVYYKTCMVESCDINYTPNGGSISILKGGKPAFVEISMSLSETDIHTSEDYGGVSSFENGVDQSGGRR